MGKDELQAGVTVLALRTCKADMISYGGFLWPESGPVSAPDWDPEPVCGHGLHGLLWGEGDNHLDWSADAKWLACRVDASKIVDLGGKVKFPSAEVVFCGDRKGATEYIATNGGAGKSIHGYTATAGYSGTATAGYRGTATAGDSGTATAGYSGTATAGDGGTATAGDSGTATAGDGGTATAGDSGTATAGDRGTATAGYSGTATAGDRGTATAGDRGTATAGVGGVIAITYWNGKRFRAKIGHVIFAEILRCRAAQDAKWGGSAHDDTHSPADWTDFIRKFMSRACDANFYSEFEGALIHVAALCVAAIQSTRRRKATKRAQNIPEIIPPKDILGGTYQGNSGPTFPDGRTDIEDPE